MSADVLKRALLKRDIERITSRIVHYFHSAKQKRLLPGRGALRNGRYSQGSQHLRGKQPLRRGVELRQPPGVGF
jgi:hypothetical protein